MKSEKVKVESVVWLAVLAAVCGWEDSASRDVAFVAAWCGLMSALWREHARVGWGRYRARPTTPDACVPFNDYGTGYLVDVSGTAIWPRCWARTGRSVPMIGRNGKFLCLACGLEVIDCSTKGGTRE